MTINSDFPSSRNNGRWAVGMTTAPREPAVIAESVKSVLVAGWHPTVFAEPGSPRILAGADWQLDLPWVQRPHRLGAWHNWYAMVQELLAAAPHADWILTLQDDAQLAPRTREFLEDEWLGCDSGVGLVSLYTPAHYARSWLLWTADGVLQADMTDERLARTLARRKRWRLEAQDRPPGPFQIVTRNLWGAVALAFPRRALEQLVAHPTARNWRGARHTHRDPADVANVDTAIGRCLDSLGLSMWFYQPSLAQHIAPVSSLPAKKPNTGNRRATQLATDPFLDCRPSRAA